MLPGIVLMLYIKMLGPIAISDRTDRYSALLCRLRTFSVQAKERLYANARRRQCTIKIRPVIILQLERIRIALTRELPSQRLVPRSFDVFFDLRLNKWLSKQ